MVENTQIVPATAGSSVEVEEYAHHDGFEEDESKYAQNLPDSALLLAC